MSPQRGSKSSGDAGSTRHVRRPIPLPPESLRPPPRKARSRRAEPSPTAAPGRARKSGGRRGFWIGLTIPLLGFLVAGLYLGRDGLFPGADSRAAGSNPEPEMQVRARFDRAETGGDSPAETAVPAEAVSGDPAGGNAGGPETEQGVPGDPGEVLAIQLASFRTQRKAERVLDEARRRTGLPGVILPAMVDGIRWQRILLGAFSSTSEARDAARPLVRDGTIGELVIRPVPPEWVPALTGKDSK